ncbi:MAG: bifunctional folylpolyglutamate synthase/dihydrofolate synthase [Bacteroidales bacterium]|jgi:dihydrofolate synthase/folylpolyglutamate synthase|nr:bifunctional folylpolyglutamate synthase/dihydrofolate synthase [Bacteroidales bacterium]
MMNYKQTTEYLFRRLPMFQRIGGSAYKADLSNTVNLMNALNNPQNSFRSLHVAGTNGKGSTSHLLASILRQRGLNVGLHTSPHLVDFRERIRVNGVMCEEDFVVEFVDRNKDIIERIEPSFFELAVAMAFKYFEREKVDIAVIEVGMGGRLDSTNVITPLLSVITNIGFDHTQFLGTTLQRIATEKAGIIKPNIPVIIGQSQQETKQIFIDKTSKDTPIIFADEALNVKNIRSNGKLILDIYSSGELKYKDISLPLCGDYQQKNIVTVIAAVEELNRQGFGITEEDLRLGIMNLQTNAPLYGRWQILNGCPMTICDTGHNEDGLRWVINQLNRLPHDTLRIVFGVVNDKDLSHIFPLLPPEAHYYLCKADIPRGLDVNTLHRQFKDTNRFLHYTSFPSVSAAYDAAAADATDRDVIFIGGSTFTVAAVMEAIFGGGDRTSGGRDRTFGGRDRTSGGRDKNSGGRDRTSGGRDRTSGGRDKNSGGRDKNSGGRDKN